MSKKKKPIDDENGFEDWGGYMGAKISKLKHQFALDAANSVGRDRENKIFNDVAIFVNGYTVPSSDELKLLMIKHGGVYHHYYDSRRTTHVIASNLPNCKMKLLKTIKVVKPEWITESIQAKKLLDYRSYLLYTNQTANQPKLLFKDRCTLPDNSSSISDQETKDCLDIEFEEEESMSQSIEGKLKSGRLQSCVTVESSSCATVVNGKCNFIPSKEVKVNHNLKVSSAITARDERFLSEFYSNSRLHHISTMGAMFKQYVNQLRTRSNQCFSGLSRLKGWSTNVQRSGQPCENICNEDDEECVMSDNGRPSSGDKTVIMHIDMDCFFVSVGIRNRPELNGSPVAVTHAKGRSKDELRNSNDLKTEIDLYKNRVETKIKTCDKNDLAKSGDACTSSSTRYGWASVINKCDSMSEVASCSYEARKAGVKNGMFLGHALKLCPNLKTIPYDFEAYKEVSYILYNTVSEYTLDIEAVSCDEMFVDCTNILKETGCTAIEFASFLRKEVKEKTGCPCSTGFGSNRLQARLATKKAKPDGQYFLKENDVVHFMKDVKVADLPGVGKTLAYKLSTMNVNSCLDLQNCSLSELQSEFGNKTGEALYKHCRGQDEQNLSFGHIRKSVSAEVNYGIRFQTQEEAEKFLHQLSCEVKNRLQEVQMKTKCITLKLMVKAKDAPENTAKYLGHGFCDNVSKSCSFNVPVSDVSVISREVILLFRKLKIIPKNLRGVGVQLSRLVPENNNRSSNTVLDRFFKPDSIGKQLEGPTTDNKVLLKSPQIIDNEVDGKHCISTKNNKTVNLSALDKSFLANLPEDIRKEVIDDYEKNYCINLQGKLNMVGKVLESPNSQLAQVNSNIQENITASKVRNDMDSLQLDQVNQSFIEALPVNIWKEIKNHIQETTCNNYISKNLSDEPVMESELKGTESKMPLDEMKDMLRTWVKEELSPQLDDINTIFSIIVKLVYGHCIVDLRLVLNTFYRYVIKKENDSWKEAYRKIIKLIQKAMVEEYGGELKLDYDLA